MGEMKRAESRYKAEYAMKQDRFASTLVIAAALIAAVRLAREPDVSKPSPRVLSAVAESVALARMILDKVIR
jgi:hypothetical protein